MSIDLHDLTQIAVDHKASDLFIKAHTPPTLRVHGKIVPLDLPLLTPEDTKRMMYDIMTERQQQQFEATREMDLAFTFGDLARFRVNAFQQRGTLGMVLRIIPLKVSTIEELDLPLILKEVVKRHQGLILVTGPTGCGKSTTLAAMIDYINSIRRCHIVTIEDPIEYVHEDNLAIITQREVGIDTDSFTIALKHVVRQSPDIILIGEMRDIETMHIALVASETGHLVFSTVHTTSAAETIDRLINMFPPHDKPQICLRLSMSLVAVISQKLIPRLDGTGRVPAVEIMIGTPTISKIIAEGKTGDIYAAIKEGKFWGMQTLNQSLYEHYKARIISEEDAIAYAGNETEMKQLVRREAAPTSAAAAARRPL